MLNNDEKCLFEHDSKLELSSVLVAFDPGDRVKRRSGKYGVTGCPKDESELYPNYTYSRRGVVWCKVESSGVGVGD